MVPLVLQKPESNGNIYVKLFCRFKMIFNPLARILDDNRLTGPNYVDWKRNLMIVLSADKIGYVLTSETPELALNNATEEEKRVFNKWHDDDNMAKCYIMVLISNVLQKDCEGVATAAGAMLHL